MSPSEADRRVAEPVAGATLAVTAEVLYLVNLLLVPGLAFVILLVIYLRNSKTAPPLARCHLRQTFAASLWAGVLLVLVNGLILALGGYQAPATWVVLILYFVTCHASLVLLGVLGLAKAMAGQSYRYPVIGRPCD
ncbi:MAG: hypothetical protein KKA36_03725 [Gammaproteobacteria bacterium]|nr:hypothetical protein [Gammaproteobacteria bacterium]MBU2478175.1 hypothetical protein [Gammaproteobacteria bacterium]